MLFAEKPRTPVRELFATVRELLREQISETPTPGYLASHVFGEVVRQLQNRARIWVRQLQFYNSTAIAICFGNRTAFAIFPIMILYSGWQPDITQYCLIVLKDSNYVL